MEGGETDKGCSKLEKGRWRGGDPQGGSLACLFVFPRSWEAMLAFCDGVVMCDLLCNHNSLFSRVVQYSRPSRLCVASTAQPATNLPHLATYTHQQVPFPQPWIQRVYSRGRR